MLNEKTAQVLLHYNVHYQEITPILMGLINETYLVRTGKGNFILQKMHSIYQLDTIVKVAAIGEFLQTQRSLAPLTVRTKEGRWGWEEEGRWWRLSTFIPGRVIEKVSNLGLAYEAGKILGQFHKVMQNYSGDLRETRPIHDYVWHWTEFSKVAVGKLDPEIESLRKIIFDLPQLFLPGVLEKTVTHGDPKISNIIFEESIDQAKAMIDLDGCNKGNNVIIELSDAFRSWCGSDESDSRNSFDLDKFTAGWNGYRDGRKGSLKHIELMLLPRAVKLVILGLASRFLRDYFEDKYFGWDSQHYSSRRAHNLARARGQVALYQDFLQKESVIENIVKNG